MSLWDMIAENVKDHPNLTDYINQVKTKQPQDEQKQTKVISPPENKQSLTSMIQSDMKYNTGSKKDLRKIAQNFIDRNPFIKASILDYIEIYTKLKQDELSKTSPSVKKQILSNLIKYDMNNYSQTEKEFSPKLKAEKFMERNPAVDASVEEYIEVYTELKKVKQILRNLIRSDLNSYSQNERELSPKLKAEKFLKRNPAVGASVEDYIEVYTELKKEEPKGDRKPRSVVVYPEVSSQILCKLISYIKCYYNTNRTKNDMLKIFCYNNPGINVEYKYFSKVYDCVHKSLLELVPGERFDKIQVEKSVRKCLGESKIPVTTSDKLEGIKTESPKNKPTELDNLTAQKRPIANSTQDINVQKLSQNDSRLEPCQKKRKLDQGSTIRDKFNQSLNEDDSQIYVDEGHEVTSFHYNEDLSDDQATFFEFSEAAPRVKPVHPEEETLEHNTTYITVPDGFTFELI